MWSNVELPAIKTKLPLNGRHENPRTTHTNTPFSSCDLDIDPMTLIHDNDPDFLKVWPHTLHTKNELSRSRISEVRAIQTDRQTHRQMRLCKNKWYFGKMIWLLCEIRRKNKCSKLTFSKFQHLHSSAEKNQCRLLCLAPQWFHFRSQWHVSTICDRFAFAITTRVQQALALVSRNRCLLQML